MYIYIKYIHTHGVRQEPTSSPHTHHTSHRLSWKCISVGWQLTVVYVIAYEVFKTFFVVILIFEHSVTQTFLLCHHIIFYYQLVPASQFSLKSQHKSRENGNVHPFFQDRIWAPLVIYELKSCIVLWTQFNHISGQWDLILCFTS